MSISLEKEWLKAAYADIVVLETILTNEFVTQASAFHSQQAIEKSLKALIISKKTNVPRVHSLTKLFYLCSELEKYNNFDLIQLLDSLYTDSRYPGEMGLLPNGKPSLQDAKEFYEFALDTFSIVCNLLNITIEDLQN